MTDEKFAQKIQEVLKDIFPESNPKISDDPLQAGNKIVRCTTPHINKAQLTAMLSATPLTDFNIKRSGAEITIAIS